MLSLTRSLFLLKKLPPSAAHHFSFDASSLPDHTLECFQGWGTSTTSLPWLKLVSERRFSLAALYR